MLVLVDDAVEVDLMPRLENVCAVVLEYLLEVVQTDTG
jgi:hypothetical protein